ncbi:nucleoside hydrolase [Microbacterium sp. ASV81]|uniref:Nucleoside hydrolase n=1 Tax=Microbacterium capsulatum TaxID=3041921 RepID=A0ABU0XJ51_9MICO|nr:nucleoside hydrolase [Microbacterium sp. ASV81]MDQ4215169.1 nucleoside hydrolase [Microbacterium sp. ASV81]
MTTRILLDADTGIDDAVALVYLLAQEDVDLVGIACTAGNVGVDHVVRNTLAVLDLLGATDIPVARGAALPLVQPFAAADAVHGESGLGHARLAASSRSLDPRSAAELWIDAVRAHPGEIVGLVTGPLTNIALALRLEPRLPELLRGLVVMGGAFEHRGNVGGTAEWNIFVDPEAAAMVLDAYRGRDLGHVPVLCGLDITERVLLTPQHLDELRRMTGESPVSRFLDDALGHYFDYHAREVGRAVAPLHDPLAAVIAAGRDVRQELRAATVEIELRGEHTRGMTVPRWVSGAGAAGANAQVVRDVDVDAVLAVMLRAFEEMSRRSLA